MFPCKRLRVVLTVAAVVLDVGAQLEDLGIPTDYAPSVNVTCVRVFS